MLEFIFFHQAPVKIFMEWLQSQNIQAETTQQDEAYTITMDENMPDDLYDAVEAKYTELLEYNEDIMKQEQGDELGYHMAGIAVHLSDGRVSYAEVDPKLMGRIISVVSPEEFSGLVDAIVTAVENPQEKTFCERQRESE